MPVENQYEFPITKAMQCIPEFRGASAELDGFIFQIDYFAKNLPDKNEAVANDPVNTAETELIHVVLSKLKGTAALQFKRINAKTWNEVKENLQKEFGDNFKLEEIFHKVETLEQGQHETFQSYKDRVLILKSHIDEYEKNKDNGKDGEESYAQRNLRIHFLGGLKNRNLKTLAKSHKEETLEDLIEYLEEECIDVEQLEHIEKRLQDSHIAEYQRQNKDQKNNNPQPRKFDNYRSNNNSYGNRTFNQRNWNQDRNRRPQGGYSNSFSQNNKFREQNNYRDHFSGNNNSYRNSRDRFDGNSYRNDRDQFDNNRGNHSYDNNRINRNQFNPNSNQNYEKYEHNRENNWNNRNFNKYQERKN